MKPMIDEVKFKDFAKWWLNTRVAARSTAQTVERYDMNLRVHIFPMYGELLLMQIAREHADMLISKLRASNHNPVG